MASMIFLYSNPNPKFPIFIYKSVTAIRVLTDSSLLTSPGLVLMLVIMVEAAFIVPLILPSCSLHVMVNNNARLNLKS